MSNDPASGSPFELLFGKDQPVLVSGFGGVPTNILDLLSDPVGFYELGLPQNSPLRTTVDKLLNEFPCTHTSPLARRMHYAPHCLMNERTKEILRHGFATNFSQDLEKPQLLQVLAWFRESIANLLRWNTGEKRMLIAIIRIGKADYLTSLVTGAPFDDLDDLITNYVTPLCGKFEENNPLATSSFKDGLKGTLAHVSLSNGGRYERLIGVCNPKDTENYDAYQYTATVRPKEHAENIMMVDLEKSEVLAEIIERLRTLKVQHSKTNEDKTKTIQSRPWTITGYTIVNAVRIRPCPTILSKAASVSKALAHHLSDFAAIPEDVSVKILLEPVCQRNQVVKYTHSIDNAHSKSKADSRRTLLVTLPFTDYPICQKDETRVYRISGEFCIYWDEYAIPGKGVARDVDPSIAGGAIYCPDLGKRFSRAKSRLDQHPVLLLSSDNSNRIAEDALWAVLGSKADHKVMDYSARNGCFYVTLTITDQRTDENGESIDFPYFNVFPDFIAKGDLSKMEFDIVKTMKQLCSALANDKILFKGFVEFVLREFVKEYKEKCSLGMATGVMSPCKMFVLDLVNDSWTEVGNKHEFLTPLVVEPRSLIIAIKDEEGEWVTRLEPRYSKSTSSTDPRDRAADIIQLKVEPLSDQTRNLIRQKKLNIPCPIEVLHYLTIPPYQFIKNVNAFLHGDPPEVEMTDLKGYQEREGHDYRAPFISRNFLVNAGTRVLYRLPQLNIEDLHRPCGERHEVKDEDQIRTEFMIGKRAGGWETLPIIDIVNGMAVINLSCHVARFLFLDLPEEVKNITPEHYEFNRYVLDTCKIFRREDFTAELDEIPFPSLPFLRGREGKYLGLMNMAVLNFSINGGKMAHEKTKHRGSYWAHRREQTHISPELRMQAELGLNNALKKLGFRS